MAPARLSILPQDDKKMGVPAAHLDRENNSSFLSTLTQYFDSAPSAADLAPGGIGSNTSFLRRGRYFQFTPQLAFLSCIASCISFLYRGRHFRRAVYAWTNAASRSTVSSMSETDTISEGLWMKWVGMETAPVGIPAPVR